MATPQRNVPDENPEEGWTGSQAAKALSLIVGIPCRRNQIEGLLRSGLLKMLLQADFERIDRAEFTRVCNVQPFSVKWESTMPIGGRRFLILRLTCALAVHKVAETIAKQGLRLATVAEMRAFETASPKLPLSVARAVGDGWEFSGSAYGVKQRPKNPRAVLYRNRLLVAVRL